MKLENTMFVACFQQFDTICKYCYLYQQQNEKTNTNNKLTIDITSPEIDFVIHVVS